MLEAKHSQLTEICDALGSIEKRLRELAAQLQKVQNILAELAGGKGFR